MKRYRETEIKFYLSLAKTVNINSNVIQKMIIKHTEELMRKRTVMVIQTSNQVRLERRSSRTTG